MLSYLLPLAALVLFAPVARADDAADAKAVVEKAIKAAGLKADANPTMTWKDKGTFTAQGLKMTYTADWAFQGPDKYRFDLKGEFGEGKISLLVVANGDKAWGLEGNKAEEITGEKLEYTKNEVYQMWVTTLTPLAADKGFTLATAKGKDVNGKPTAAVKVMRDKRPPVTLYFDKASGLLVKSEVVVKDEFQKWKEVLDEAYFEDYKDANGVKVFTKLRVVRDGKPLIESTLSDQKLGEKLDPKLFEKP
jgi:outer membrane lipoprotein-sorting protein